MCVDIDFKSREDIDSEVLRELNEDYKWHEYGDMLYPYNQDIGDRC